MAHIPKLRSRSMRSRHQEGWVEERGNRLRRWYGHYFVYVQDENGKEIRRHVGVSLGDKSKLRKWEAEQELRKIIASATGSQPRKDGGVTVECGVYARGRLRNYPSCRARARGTGCNRALIWFQRHIRYAQPASRQGLTLNLPWAARMPQCLRSTERPSTFRLQPQLRQIDVR